jgi:Zinc finger, C2H2 type
MPHEPGKKKKYFCTELKDDLSVCGKGYTRKNDLTTHVREHKNGKCNVCTHMKPNGEPCGQPFTQAGNLRRHINSQHLKLKEHKCEYIINEETGEKCVECFAEKQQLEWHMVDHTGVFPFVCERLMDDEDGSECVYKCKMASEMYAHVMAHHTDKDSPEYIEYREKKNQAQRERYAKDVEYRLKGKARKANSRLKKRGSVSISTLVLIGCTLDEAVAHLHNNPHGYTLDTPDIDVDHIRPICSFALASGPVEMHKCMNFNNLQLLPKKENRGPDRCFYDAVAYALSDAGQAIAKLVPGWIEKYRE